MATGPHLVSQKYQQKDRRNFSKWSSFGGGGVEGKRGHGPHLLKKIRPLSIVTEKEKN